jgi:hypothetical protein
VAGHSTLLVFSHLVLVLAFEPPHLAFSKIRLKKLYPKKPKIFQKFRKIFRKKLLLFLEESQ